MHVICQSLQDVEYKDDDSIVWKIFTPHIVVDPSREFGQPIIDRVSIPTDSIFQTFNSYKSRDAVIDGFKLSEDEFDRAIEFECNLASRRVAA